MSSLESWNYGTLHLITLSLRGQTSENIQYVVDWIFFYFDTVQQDVQLFQTESYFQMYFGSFIGHFVH